MSKARAMTALRALLASGVSAGLPMTNSSKSTPIVKPRPKPPSPP